MLQNGKKQGLLHIVLAESAAAPLTVSKIYTHSPLKWWLPTRPAGLKVLLGLRSFNDGGKIVLRSGASSIFTISMPYITHGFLRADSRNSMGFILLYGKKNVSRFLVIVKVFAGFCLRTRKKMV